LFEALKKAGEDLTRPGQQFHLPLRLIVRQSTGPARVTDRRSKSR